jgi:hypothetical protein
MQSPKAIADHWGKGDVLELVLSALEKAGKSTDALTLEDLAPIDHLHARGFPATVELADRLPVESAHHVLDIGCGLGGPARYFAACRCGVIGPSLATTSTKARTKSAAEAPISTRMMSGRFFATSPARSGVDATLLPMTHEGSNSDHPQVPRSLDRASER